MHNLVYEVGGDAWFCLSCRNIQHLTRQPTNLTHAFYLRRIEYGNLVPSNKNLL
jgi:hypothetical protein